MTQGQLITNESIKSEGEVVRESFFHRPQSTASSRKFLTWSFPPGTLRVLPAPQVAPEP